RPLGTLLVLVLRIPRNRDQARGRRDRILLKCLREAVAVGVRQTDVAEDDIRLLARSSLDAIHGRFSDGDLVAAKFQQPLQRFGRIPVVFHHQDPLAIRLDSGNFRARWLTRFQHLDAAAKSAELVRYLETNRRNSAKPPDLDVIEAFGGIEQRCKALYAADRNAPANVVDRLYAGSTQSFQAGECCRIAR